MATIVQSHLKLLFRKYFITNEMSIEENYPSWLRIQQIDVLEKKRRENKQSGNWIQETDRK